MLIGVAKTLKQNKYCTGRVFEQEKLSFGFKPKPDVLRLQEITMPSQTVY